MKFGLKHLILLVAGAAAMLSPAAAQDKVADVHKPVTAAQASEDIRARLPNDLKARGTITSVVTTANPPLHYFDTDGQTLIGVDIDLSKAIGQVLGFEVTMVGTDLKNLIPGVQSQRYDMAVNTLVPTPERLEILDFLDYISFGAGLATTAENADQIKFEDLSICGRTVAVVTGSIQELEDAPEASRLCVEAGKPELDLHSFPDFQSSVLSLGSGRTDAVLYTYPAVVYLANEDARFRLADQISARPQAIGFPKQSPLLEPVRLALEELKQSGIYEEILTKWGMSTGMVDEFVITQQ